MRNLFPRGIWLSCLIALMSFLAAHAVCAETVEAAFVRLAGKIPFVKAGDDGKRVFLVREGAAGTFQRLQAKDGEIPASTRLEFWKSKRPD